MFLIDAKDQEEQLLKARIKDNALSLFILYNKISASLNSTKEEFSLLKPLSKDDRLIIQKSDKGNSIIISNKDNNLQNMQNILYDSSKFSEVCIAKEKHLSFFINIEKQITDLLKQLNNS